MNSSTNRAHGNARRGFALVVTVSILVLLALVAVGMLSLSTISVRSSGQGEALNEARSNARLAAMMAIGQLQNLTGLDTRVTASSRLIDESNVEATGVWRSWEGTNHDNNGKPTPPDYYSKRETADADDPIGADGSGRFLGYLTSTALDQTASVSEVPGSSQSQTGGMVKMVSTGTLGTTSTNRVYLEPTIIASENGLETGAMSWWTTGDNSKALLNVSDEIQASDASDWQQRLRGNRLPDPGVFGLGKLDELTDDDTSIPSRRSLDLVEGAPLDEDEFYDLTSYSTGLLTNVATGGWRKDLSLFSEYYSSLPNSGLPLFSHVPGQTLKFNKATQSSRPGNALLYHWADYKGDSGSSPWRQTPPICAWEALANYMTKYQDLTSRSASRLSMNEYASSVGGSGTGARYNFQEEIRVFPVVARIKWILSLGSVKSGEQYKPGFVLTPIVTLWNPYNVNLEVRGYKINFRKVFPLRITYQVGREQFTSVDLNSIIKSNIAGNFPAVISLAPGENKIYGVNNPTPLPNSGAQALQFTQGYTPNGGVIFTRIKNGAEITVSDGQFSVTNIEFAANRNENMDGGGVGENIAMRFHASSQTSSGNPNIITMTYVKSQLGGDRVINQLYPPLRSRISHTISQISGTNNKPFTAATLGLRMIAPPPIGESRFDNIRTKGILHSNPLQQYAEVGVANDNSALTNLAGSGANHPINAPYDFMFEEAQSWNDSAVTVDFDQSSRGFLVSGNRAANGVQRCVMAELPIRPLQSLADLQHFDVRNNNQMPPFQFNLIGNASAHPLFETTQVSINTSGSFGNLTNDDSYLLNHVLFDDWFVSSITQDLAGFSSRAQRSGARVMTEFLDGEEPLPNWYYLPNSLAGAEDSAKLASTYNSGRQDRKTGIFPFQSVASLLEVEGMFNINSVSVDAWRAILGRNRDIEVPYFSSRGSVTTEESEDPVFPRTTIAGDLVSTGTTAVANGSVMSAAVSGYTALSDDHIDALAEEIVNQIRKRGPFLSLSEFVNRQLSSDKDLALAGTIQRALDMLAETSGSTTNPYLDLINAGEMISSVPPGTTDFKFPEAAMGSSNFGVPGWMRQADVLRPLAPVMSARDDTFTIRAYGDSRDSSGNVQARAWAEVVVQRTPEFVNEVDDAALNPHASEIESETNRRFGRHFRIVSFRWLNEDEV